MRELSYEGALAGISFDMSVTSEEIMCQLASYNQAYDRFFAEAFKEIKTFEPDKRVFSSKKEQICRSLKNHELQEPYQRASGVLREILRSHEHSTPDLLDTITKMSFEDFMRLKDRWLSSLELTWLIQGHLTAQEALSLVNTAESSLKFERITEEDVLLKRCVRLNDRIVYQYTKPNKDEKNPNSFCSSSFAYKLDNDYNDAATLRVLAELLREPVFNQLRTKE